MIAYKEEALELLPNQGHCNENYLFYKEGKKYHLRRFKLQDRDRKLEFKIQNIAARRGIGARAHYHDSTIMIGDFVEGVHREKLSRQETKALAKVLKKLHTIPFYGKPTLLKPKIEKRFKPDFALCHNDLNVKNILFGRHVKFIDWEYAGMGDRYFDLATVCEAFSLDERYFLRNYGGKINHDKLKAYKQIYKDITKEWFLKLEKGALKFLP
jgi:aminoglycoside phosphotransferase (APT) family kinase protein